MTRLHGISRPPTDDFILKQALAAIDETGKITYYKVTGYVTYMVSPEERGNEKSTEYYWIDNARGIVKSSFTPIFGQPGRVSFISDGKRQLRFEGSRQQFVSESRSPRDINGSLTDIKAQAKNYRRMLTDGRAEIIGEETTRGVAAYIVRDTRGPWEDDSGKITMTVCTSRAAAAMRSLRRRAA